ncbi:xyloglucan endotransglucosylase/hydrolase protein 2-like [Prosopis cineraria]|uniref:xyloglucan endotransglucosylase/hydrolase protein 2-like n=1 Tax=Prosopis cineraria TaxID=364024 RepID=UPI00240E9F19|nr:xyloglucan endotransglucosylase/hydrolase protein 2-like [Prosopis cineraria]
MESWLLFVFVIINILVAKDNKGIVVGSDNNDEVSFEEHYEVMYGDDHVVLPSDRANQLQLSMDNSSGSGFGSKMTYGSGFFHMRIKVPGGDTSGVVTAYYLSSHGDHHDEIDYEFLGNKEGGPHTLQTNIYVDGNGGREQRLHLWFDPSQGFHNYSILFNQHQIVFFVDRVPIRVYKNKTDIGAGYPTKAMRIEATLWDGNNWATNGGKSKVNWDYAPFQASFKDFGVRGCEVQTFSSSSNLQDCFSDRFSWNRQKFWQLDPTRQTLYENVQKTYVTYDYCDDSPRFSTRPKEC